MARRWGPGPVFVFESLVAARRWPYYAARAVFALALMIALWVVWENSSWDGRAGQSGLSRAKLAQLGQQFYEAIAAVQITLILLAAPAATAGAVCLDRARGTLTHVLVTDLSDTEVVVGKLASRLAPVLALVASATPVLAIAGLLGGIVPEAVLTLVVVTVGVAVLGCALALAVSVRVLKAHEVLLVVYTALALWLLSALLWIGLARSGYAPGVPDWYLKLNPYVLAYAPFEAPAFVAATDLPVYAGFVAAVSGLFTWVSIRTLRREVTSGFTRSERLERWGAAVRARLFSWWPSPSLDANPVLWREWHRNRPSRTARRVWALYTVLALAGTSWGVYEIVRHGVGFGLGSGFTEGANAFQVTFALLFLSASAPTVLSEERVRGSLDVLMATPLPTRTIVLGKWWGVFRGVPVLAVLPGLGAFLYAASAMGEFVRFNRFIPQAPPLETFDRVAAAFFPVAWVLAHGAVLASLGVGLATWFAKPGRAIAASVGLYVAATVGSVLFVETVAVPVILRCTWYQRGDSTLRALEEGMLSFSPYGGQIVPLEVITSPWGPNRAVLWKVQAVMLAATLAFAAGVLALTLATFNRCLGRVEEFAPTGPRRPPEDDQDGPWPGAGRPERDVELLPVPPGA